MSESLKQRIVNLPLIGGLLYWIVGVVRMNALRRQNAQDHAHFLALHDVTQAQMKAQAERFALQLTTEREQMEARLAQLQVQNTALAQELQQLRLQQQDDLRQFVEQSRIAEQFRAASAQADQQLQSNINGVDMKIAEVAQHQASEISRLDESLLQATIATEIVEQRVAGITQVLRKRPVPEKT